MTIEERGMMDAVRCNNCEQSSTVVAGESICPHCGFDGALIEATDVTELGVAVETLREF
jgi:Zn finger protein HypA/HybF involved in hydrogenase expression